MRIPSAAIAVLFSMVAASAAGQTASLRGTATVQRAPMQGVVVTVRSSALQGVRSTRTGPAGSYQFLALPPGVYTVAFEREGFARVVKTAQLSLSLTSILDVDMNLAQFSEEMTISKVGEHFSTRAPAMTMSISGDDVDLLPVERDVLSTAALAAGVNTTALGINKQPVISGGPGYDNLVMVNGAVITNSDGNLHSLFIEDAIAQTTVLSGGISAEYGRFTGGVVNAVTKSGGNQWNGSLRDNISNPAWTESMPSAAAAETPDILDHVFQETLGGFVLRDHLWFFIAGRQATNNRARVTTLAFAPYVSTAREARYEGKLTARVAGRHTVTASMLHVDNVSSNLTFQRVYDLDSLFRAAFPATMLAAHYDGVLARNFLVEGHYARKRFANKNNGSPFTDLIRGTPIVNRNGNIRMNSATFCGVCGARRTYNTSYQLKASQFISSEHYGDHTLVGGSEYFSEQRTINNYLSGSGFTVFTQAVQIENGRVYPRFSNEGFTFIRWTPVLRESDGNDLATISGFVNDEWRINDRLSANIGIRYDRNRAVDSDGARVSDDDAFSPRLGIVYELSARQHLSAGYSRYVSDMTDGKISGAGETAGMSSQIDFAYRGPAVNPAETPRSQLLLPAEALRILFAWFNQACDSAGRCGTANLSLLQPGGLRETPGFAARIGRRLASPRADEIFAGYAFEPVQNLSTRINAVFRKWSRFYGYRVDESTPRERDVFGIAHDIALVENTDDIKRLYQATQIQAQWHRSLIRGGMTYTWSRLRGNDEQENGEVRAVPNSPLSKYYPGFLSYENRLPVGYLNQDQRHRARAWIGYDAPLSRRVGHLNVSVLESFDSGRPYSARGLIKTTGYDGAATNVSYTGGIPDDYYYFSRRGAFRMKNVVQTDIAFNFRRGVARAELFVQADLLNALNDSVPISVDTTVLTAATTKSLKTFNPYREAPVEGVHYVLPSSFGGARDPDSYQRPRTYQFSMGLRF